MASYVEELMADRERLRRALTGVIEAEAAAVRELQANSQSYARALDEQIVRYTIYRTLYGPTQAETERARIAVEEASKPHVTAELELEQHQRILQALQEALMRIERGEPIDATASDADAKLTVADILSE